MAERADLDQGGGLLVMSGRVIDSQGNPVPDVELSVVGVNAGSTYHPLDAQLLTIGSRTKSRSATDGYFHIFMTMPLSEESASADRDGLPKHVRITIAHPGFEALTKLIFFDADCQIGAHSGRAKKSPVTPTWSHYEADDQLKAHNFERSFVATTFDLQLEKKPAAEAA